MVDVTLTIMNEDLSKIRSYIEEQNDRLIEDMCAPVVTPESDRANVVFSLLNRLDAQLSDFEVLLARKEEEASKA